MLTIDTKDKLLLLMSAMLAAYASIMLMQPEPSSFSGRKSSLPIAEVRSYSNIVKKKPAESLSWEGVKNERELFQGDQVFTHDNSFAEIVYRNATSLNLLPNTLLKIEENEDGINIDLKKGFLSLNFTKDTKKKIKLKVGKKILEIDSKDAIFQISSINNKSQITLIKGKAKVNTGKKSKAKVLKNGDSIKIDTLDNKIEISRVDIFPLAPKMGSNISLLSGPVQFKWKVKDKAKHNYKLLISKSPSLRNAKTIETSSKLASLKYLAPGSYYWKVKSEINGKSFEGPTSSFRIAPPASPRPLSPNSGQIFNIGIDQQAANVNLKWTGKYPKGFIVSIEAAGKEAKLVSSKSSQIILKQVKGSAYTWKVRANEKGAPWSPSSQFEIKRENYLKPMLPELNEKIKILSLKEKVPFEWFGLKEETYKVQVFKDKKMTNEVLSKEVKGIKTSLSFNKFGPYFWKVSSKDYPDITTEPIAFLVKASIASLIEPTNKAKLYMLKKDRYKVKFNWRNLGLKEYPSELQVATDKKFKKITSKLKIKGTVANLPINTLGQYYWRIVPTNTGNDDLSRSKVRSFNISLPAAPKAPNIDMKTVLELLEGQESEQYVIAWPRVKYAKEYLIEIYNGNNLDKRLTQAKVKKPKISWHGERFGAFYYRVKVYDQWGRESKWSKLGKLVAPISPFDY